MIPALEEILEPILAPEKGKDRCIQAVRELSIALAVPHEDALRIRDDVAFFGGRSKPWREGQEVGACLS